MSTIQKDDAYRCILPHTQQKKKGGNCTSSTSGQRCDFFISGASQTRPIYIYIYVAEETYYIAKKTCNIYWCDFFISCASQKRPIYT